MVLIFVNEGLSMGLLDRSSLRILKTVCWFKIKHVYCTLNVVRLIIGYNIYNMLKLDI